MSRTDTDNPTPEAVRKAQQDKAKLNAQQEVVDVKWLMSSSRGRRIVWRDLANAGVFRAVFNTNAMQMAFNEGARSAGLQLLTIIHTATPDLYHLMVKENAGE